MLVVVKLVFPVSLLGPQWAGCEQGKHMLSDLKVLELSHGIAASFCAKLLADLGATVVKIEPVGGDRLRRLSPVIEGHNSSAQFEFFNTSKQSIVLDIEDEGDRNRFYALVSDFDIVIASGSNELLRERGLAYETLAALNPGVILTTISGFGSFGPHSLYRSNHLINCAVGGWSQLCGIPEREPLQTGGQVTETLTGAYAAAATLLAAFSRRKHGVGDHIDVSVQEATLAGASIPTLLYEYRGLVAERYSSVGSGAGAGYMLPTTDGYIGLNALTLAQWELLCEFLDRQDIAHDEYYAGISLFTPDSRLEELRAIFSKALAGRSASELFHEAQLHRVPFGLVPTIGELLDLQPHIEREFFCELESMSGYRVTVPGLPFKSNAVTLKPAAAPVLDADREWFDNATKEEAPPRLGKVPMPRSVNHPLQGIRVVDLSMFFAGPVAAQIMADAGADVIKVESIQRIDGWRGSGTQDQEGLPDWEASPYFNWVNRNKRDITLNLKDPRGVEVVKTLIGEADIVVENFTPRVMAEFGLDYDTLREIKPDLIMISLSGYGAEVSWRDYVAFGMSTEQMSGISSLTGYLDGAPLYTGMTGGDLYSGVMGATIVAAALHHRVLTGEGQHIDFSQTEACNLYLGDEVAAYSVTGEELGRQGNHHRDFAPQGIYACADGWLAISCEEDAHWHILCDQAGLISWRGWAVEKRRVRRNEIDAALSKWCAGEDKQVLWHRLQNAGIGAGAVLNGPELLEDPQLNGRGFFLPQDRPGLGVKNYPNQPYRFRNAAAPPVQRSPLLGEHLVEVLSEEVGLSDDEIAELVIDDVTGTVPLAAR
jgi:crotonobetainyl-CoA:carnitine CoA-transferase CaiB-like acyl-CoA transferase